MALIKCSECGKDVSDKAESCPNCGCPVSYSYKTNIPEEEKQRVTIAKKTGGWFKWLFAIVIIILVISPFLKNTDHSRKAIEIVKNAIIFKDQPTVEDIVQARINNDKSVYKIYGWEAEKVDESTYYVYFAFDYDDDRSNGYRLYPYEVNIQSEVVIEVSGNSVLENKYGLK